MFTKKDWLAAFYAALIAFCLYSCLFAFRKAFNVAAFEGYTLAGLDYKVVLVITQVAGYMASKFYGIRFIASMKRVGRGRLIIILTAAAWLSWLAFALISPPYNWPCLFFSGFPLGMLWGVVFSYIEGRRMTDFISAALAVSFIFGSGLAKSVASFSMQTLKVTEYWMPFTTGLLFAIPLLFFVFLIEKLPAPSSLDIEQRTQRLPMSGKERKQLIKTYGWGLAQLVIIYSLVTILREIRDSFMADMWRESGETFNSSVFAQTETIITVILLLLIASMVLIKNNFRAFLFTHWIMAAGFLLSLFVTIAYQLQAVTTFYWMLGVGLGLYLVYIPFNSLLFDRLIAAFRITGNVGFLIYLADSFGYLGSVAVLLSKTVFSIQLSWLKFYEQMVLITAIIGLITTIGSAIYFRRKKNNSFLEG